MSLEIEILDNEKITNRIYTVRGLQVMLDSELAELYGVELKRLNGKHIYLRSKSNFKDTPGLSEIYFEKRRDGDTVYRVADDGTPIHKLASENDKIYQDYNGNEIIVTDNLVYYLDNNNYHNIRLSDTVIKDSHKLDSIKTQLELSSKKSVKSFLNFISKVPLKYH